MIPALVVGGIVGYAIGKSSSDKKESVRTGIDESEVPVWIKKSIEEENLRVAENYFKSAENYFYGLKGCTVNKDSAKNLYTKAAELGHEGAKNQLKNLYNYNY